MQDFSLLGALAQALLAGKPTIEHLVDRCSRALNRNWRWIRPLAQRYLDKFGAGARPRRRDVVQFLRNDERLQQALAKYSNEISVNELFATPQLMQPAPAAAAWGIPSIESTGDLAKWLGLDSGELRWFADLRGLGCKENREALRHYHYRVLAKRFGAIRLIEAPKARLKDLQLQILVWILQKIPSHPAVHGFVKGRSILTFVAPHIGQRIVLRMDLRDFFPSLGGPRIQSLFRTLGYPEAVADLLGGICTNSTLRGVWTEIAPEVGVVAAHELRRFYARPHLPQGAPTSPALANLCCYRVDSRLSALAKSAGAAYTRYADDLAFSGDKQFEQNVERFALHAMAILREQGFHVNNRKTRIMRQGVRQHLAGLVTNRRPNVVRKDFDQLKAILTNCARLGPESQNREGHPHFRAHIEGRAAFVMMINPKKGERLQKILEQIHWSE